MEERIPAVTAIREVLGVGLVTPAITRVKWLISTARRGLVIFPTACAVTRMVRRKKAVEAMISPEWIQDVCSIHKPDKIEYS